VTQLSHRIPGKPHSRGLWRRLRRLLSTAESIDLDEIGNLTAKFEASQRNIQETQRALIDFLRSDARQAAPRRARQPDRTADSTIAAEAVRSVACDVAAPTRAAVRPVRPGSATLEVRPAA